MCAVLVLIKQTTQFEKPSKDRKTYILNQQIPFEINYLYSIFNFCHYHLHL